MLKLLPLLLLLWTISAAPSPAYSIDGLASPYRFALLRWEIESLVYIAYHRVLSLFALPQDEITLINNFFADQHSNIPRWRIETILSRQMEEVLRREGLSFPPVIFRLDDPPHLLIISPREKIELKRTVLLKQRMTLAEMEALEQAVEKNLEVSALVESLGGVSTYPSFVPPHSLEGVVEAIAHEWLHQYFFFHPLGRAYGKSQEMTTLNESAASLAGEEIARQLLKTFYGIQKKEEPVKEEDYFATTMRGIRLRVEELLKEGEIEEAERFMEEKRKKLAERGYRLRRLNQAYFAFHGTYAPSPASISPIEQELRLLRSLSPSLGEFVRHLASIGSYQEFQQLLKSQAPQ